MTRAEASRINGAKSKGPISEEGKKRSSRNALKHGLASPFILLPQECPDHFNRLCGDYARHFQPQNEVERDLVYEAVSCMWRIIRVQSAGSSLIESEISRQCQEVDKKFINPDDWVRLAMAFENLANNGRALGMISRYESRMMRAKDRAMEQLRKLRADPQPGEPEDDKPDENLPNEPEPLPEPEIQNAPNEPTTPETSTEPVQNQTDAAADTAPEPLLNEPDNLESLTTRDELQHSRCEHRRTDA